MTELPAYLLWHQALNFMVTGEPRDTDPALLETEHAYAKALGEPPPAHCMSLDRARAELLDRLATGAAVAIGQKRVAIGVNSYEIDSLHAPIAPTAWVNLEIDDATSDATIARLEASIPGQGYTRVRLRREDVLAAREAVLAKQRAEQTALIGLLAPIEAVPCEQTVNGSQELPRSNRRISEKEVKDWLDQRAKAWAALSAEERATRRWPGQGVMLQSCKDELGGRFSRQAFYALRWNTMERYDIKKPRSGRR